MPETTNNNHEKHNINPDNFLDNRPSHQEQQQQQQQTDSVASTKPNFSFSTNYPYAPNRNQLHSYSNYNDTYNNYNNNNSNNIYNVQRYQSPYNFHHIVSNSFAILQPDAGQAPTSVKPNAIVRPIRRIEQQPNAANTEENNNNNSNDNDNENNQNDSHLTTGRSFFSRSIQEVRSFADELSQKLRFLAPEENYTWMRSRNVSGAENSQMLQRPRFETTVPTGIFLPPPHELQLLPASMLRRHVYAYSSYPMVLHNYYNNNNNQNNNNNTNLTNKENENKEIKVSATRLNGMRVGAAAATTTTTTTNNNNNHNTSTAPPSTISTATSQATALAGGLHITKAQFQQQVRQRRSTTNTATTINTTTTGGTNKRPVVPPPEPYKNVMYDRRVVKGSNFGVGSLITEVDPFDKAAELRRRNMLLKRTMQCRNQRNVLGTPPPVKGRKHETMQTEKYLEKLIQRPPEFNADTQTDLFLEKPPTPPYIPAKVGIDKATEIGENELFHFDAEAQPIIDVLVDACIEQSMLEVAHEMELDALRRKQEEFLAQREAELAELRRLEAEELRLQAEKERRLRQDAIAKELDAEMQKSVTAAKLLQGHIASLVPEVLQNLEPASDAVKKEQVMKSVCPWLSAEVAEEVGHIVDSREILTAIVQEIIKQRAETYIGYKGEESELTLPADVCEEEGCMSDEMEACPCETETDLEECPEPTTTAPPAL